MQVALEPGHRTDAATGARCPLLVVGLLVVAFQVPAQSGAMATPARLMQAHLLGLLRQRLPQGVELLELLGKCQPQGTKFPCFLA